jgi:hypothetical protein
VTVAGDGAHDGTSEANAWTLAEAIAAAPGAGTRINIKAGTYANTTTNRALSLTGTTTAPVWWRGYNTTIGDIDSNPALTKPVISFTTGSLTTGGAHQYITNLDITGTPTARLVNVTGSSLRFDRCRMENTNAASGSHAVSNQTSSSHVFSRCSFKATSSATRIFLNGSGADMLGCVFIGGGVGLESSGQIRVIGCVFRACGSHGIQAITTGTLVTIVSCTFRGNGGDGIRFDVLPATYNLVANCLFISNGGYGINNNTGANSNVVMRLGNAFYNNTSGTEFAFGDSPSLSEITESGDPHVSSTDLSLISGALSKGSGEPGLFENESYTSYLDRGAVQRQESGGGGSGSVFGSVVR